MSIENEAYRQAKALLPVLGQQVTTSLGEGMVVNVQPLRQVITVRFADGRDVLFSSAELQEAEATGRATATQPEDRNSSGYTTEKQ
jgi:cell fate regulator YaaT (PSP1 superfamily)